MTSISPNPSKRCFSRVGPTTRHSLNSSTKVLSDAIKLKASDIHIEPYEKRLRVRFRIDGTLLEKVQPPQGMWIRTLQPY